ncbi:ogr/Delta-like zinc finger family protein [Morganella morganii]
MRQNKVKLRELTSLRENNMRKMRVICPVCEADAVIRKSNRKHRELVDLYCACSDVECGHTFVSQVTFSHTISPSAKDKEHLLKKALTGLNSEHRQMALNLINASVA